jgi:hypothetical protein
MFMVRALYAAPQLIPRGNKDNMAEFRDGFALAPAIFPKRPDLLYGRGS